ncbi:SAM-dependent methyltransferase [Maritimibacter sp. DP1N21-5]|uniref:SAM-dependent methyltransferase n=1 Tax=Maritimibacter sp. DP1N21-5 TaxID=2836867 RepID=UPI001C4508D5|nr:SAM-dependent methyltransferase [Maritimibacter sp. DP1N21-5]MBV7411092.1 nodulation S family protein [Maritimibacter sp. DP1N21-5]
MGVDRDHLTALYAGTSDPWNFEHSGYEQAKFAATRAALSRRAYASAFELGCGNGQLARILAPLCSRYAGMDAVGIAISAARRTVPDARFVQGFYPCALPAGDFDLLVLSEILYFLDGRSLRTLAREIATSWPRAEVLCVTWLGETGHDIQGEEALALFSAALTTHAIMPVTQTEGYRIDRGLPKEGS